MQCLGAFFSFLCGSVWVNYAFYDGSQAPSACKLNSTRKHFQAVDLKHLLNGTVYNIKLLNISLVVVQAHSFSPKQFSGTGRS